MISKKAPLNAFLFIFFILASSSKRVLASEEHSDNVKIIKENRKDYESIRSHRNRMEEGNIREARSAIYVLQALFSGEQNRRERLERREKRSERRQNNGISSSKLEAKAHVENHIGHHRARRRHRKRLSGTYEL